MRFLGSREVSVLLLLVSFSNNPSVISASLAVLLPSLTLMLTTSVEVIPILSVTISSNVNVVSVETYGAINDHTIVFAPPNVILGLGICFHSYDKITLLLLLLLLPLRITEVPSNTV